MSSHPDADAFVRAILHNPEDVTARLAFADWLEERGSVPNLAWAYYVRLHVEIVEHEAGGHLARRLRREADGHAAYITGTAAISPAVVAQHHSAIFHVLPASRYTVELSDWTPPTTLTRHLPITFGMGATVVPLSCRGRSVVVATENPDDAYLNTLAGERDIEIVGLRAESRELGSLLQRALRATGFAGV